VQDPRPEPLPDQLERLRADLLDRAEEHEPEIAARFRELDQHPREGTRALVVLQRWFQTITGGSPAGRASGAETRRGPRRREHPARRSVVAHPGGCGGGASARKTPMAFAHAARCERELNATASAAASDARCATANPRSSGALGGRG